MFSLSHTFIIILVIAICILIVVAVIQYANTDAHFPSLHQFSMTDNNNVIEKDGKSVLIKGLLWQHKDKLFSRWKERYFVLTKDYLSCFKKATKIAHSDMGEFIFKVDSPFSFYHFIGLLMFGGHGNQWNKLVSVKSINFWDVFIDFRDTPFLHT